MKEVKSEDIIKKINELNNDVERYERWLDITRAKIVMLEDMVYDEEDKIVKM